MEGSFLTTCSSMSGPNLTALLPGTPLGVPTGVRTPPGQ